MTKDPFFFGYGSLVNRDTHSYTTAYRARVRGWRRAWRHTTLREVAYLTVVPAHGEEIEGLIAAVPGNDWAALDLREYAYQRHPVADDLHHEAPHPVAAQFYAVEAQHSAAPSVQHPILLSYLDAVLQGYLREFGETGVSRFFATTDGWDAPILNDRAAPIYPRAVQLKLSEQNAVDEYVRDLNLIQ